MKINNIVLDKIFDPDAVKKFNAETPTWTAVCPVCHVSLTGTVSQLKEHKHDK